MWLILGGVFGLIGLWIVMAMIRVRRVKRWTLPALRGRTIGEVLDDYDHCRGGEWVKRGFSSVEFCCELLGPEETEDMVKAFFRLRFRVGLTGSVRLVEARLRMDFFDGLHRDDSLNGFRLAVIMDRIRDNELWLL